MEIDVWDLPYIDRLSGAGSAKIKEFIRRGGSYLGICAGAYYGCSLVEFAQGDPLLEVCGARELALYRAQRGAPPSPGLTIRAAPEPEWLRSASQGQGHTER